MSRWPCWCSKTKKKAIMLVYQKYHVGIEFFPHVETFFLSMKLSWQLLTTWVKTIYRLLSVGLTLLVISLLLVNKDKDIQFKTLHLFLCQYTPPKKRKVFLPQSIYNSSSDCHSILKKKMLFNLLVMTQLKSKVAYEGSMVDWSTHWTRDLAAHGSE